jgi:hypothetical protein
LNLTDMHYHRIDHLYTSFTPTSNENILFRHINPLSLVYLIIDDVI